MPKKLDIVLADALLEKKLILKKDLDELLKEVDQTNQTLQELLLKGSLFSEADLLKIYADKLGLSIIDLKSVLIDRPVLDKVPLKIASYYKFIPLEIKDKVLTIAVSSPLEVKLRDEIRMQLGYEVKVVLSSSVEISEGLKKYYGLAADTLEKISSASPQDLGMSVSQPAHDTVEDIEKLAEDASVIKLVNQIILEAYRKRATDIHIEPYRSGVSLRYRIDGILYDAKVPAEIKNFINAIISRIKIMSSLNIVERRLPQDGRAVVKVQDQVLDLRISTIPTPFGESLVIRILPTKMLFSLEKLGLSKKNLEIFEKLIHKPHGIIFVTGPTGSGKTTTLYACLNQINTKDRNIITIEDPIEYEMSGITQIQVMSEIGLDFARGLRSVLRHDPDVIMVGEVRDLETAEIAIRVALTGHLIFSTLHTNDAASGITRLVDIGVEPYLVASSVEVFIAQRLIRLLCPDCKYEDKKAPPELRELIASDLGIKSTGIKISRAKGCAKCNFTGFFGRTAIYEVLLADEAIKDLILKKAPAGQIKKVAISKGMITLRQDGWQKVVAGLTTAEEIMKVTSAEEINTVEKNNQAEDESFSGQIIPAPENKRAYNRTAAVINVSYKIVKTMEKLAERGISPEQLSRTSNISAGGLLFTSDESLSVGSILDFRIDLPDRQAPVECLAKVVRVEEIGHNKYSIAVCFLDISGVQRGRLNKYVELDSKFK